MPPKTIAIEEPDDPEPLQTAPQMPKKAPASIIPSSPMFTTPERSEKMPPIAANTSGVAKRRVGGEEARREDASSVDASLPCNQSAAERARDAEPDRPPAEPPLSARHRRRARTRAPSEPERERPADSTRVVHGGSASQKARMPSRSPRSRDGPRLGQPAEPLRRRRARPCSRRLHSSSLGRAAPAAAHRRRCPPDIDDQQLGADEEDDERLDHRREVVASSGSGRPPGRAGASKCRPAARRTGEPRRGCRPPCSGQAARPRCPMKRQVRARSRRSSMPNLQPRTSTASGEAGERAGDREREEVVLRD